MLVNVTRGALWTAIFLLLFAAVPSAFGHDGPRSASSISAVSAAARNAYEARAVEGVVLWQTIVEEADGDRDCGARHLAGGDACCSAACTTVLLLVHLDAGAPLSRHHHVAATAVSEDPSGLTSR